MTWPLPSITPLWPCATWPQSLGPLWPIPGWESLSEWLLCYTDLMHGGFNCFVIKHMQVVRGWLPLKYNFGVGLLVLYFNIHFLILYSSTTEDLRGKYCTYVAWQCKFNMVKPIVPNIFGLWSLNKSSVLLRLVVIFVIFMVCLLGFPPKSFPSKLLRWFHLNNCLRHKQVKTSNISHKNKTREKSKILLYICVAEVFFFSINHFTTSEIQLQQ